MHFVFAFFTFNGGVKDYYQTIEESILAVETGKAWAAIAFDRMFSENLLYRLISGKDIDEVSLRRSEISIWQDNSSKLKVLKAI